MRHFQSLGIDPRCVRKPTFVQHALESVFDPKQTLGRQPW
jgi:hypothetical protein